jgi:hypothetical protein
MVEVKIDPTPREVRVFGLLWLLFFAAVAAVAWWRPEGLVGAATILGVAWVVSLLFNPADRVTQLAGIALPLLFGLTGLAAGSGLALPAVLGAVCGIGVVGALLIWIAPPLGRRLYVGWMYAAAPVGWTISHVVLALVYYLVLTPVGLLVRLFGRDPMQRSLDTKAASYWIERKAQPEPARYFRQF